MSDPLDLSAPPLCHRCGAILTPGNGSFYFVKIEAIADPTPPGQAELAAGDFKDDIEALLRELRGLSERELMDQVYRRLTLLLCRPCYARWIESPTG